MGPSVHRSQGESQAPCASIGLNPCRCLAIDFNRAQIWPFVSVAHFHDSRGLSLSFERVEN